MTERQLGHYTMFLQAGPLGSNVTLDIVYYDTDGVEVGPYGETLVAFACTWKDVAETIRRGARGLRIDHDPVSNVSPMVDLS